MMRRKWALFLDSQIPFFSLCDRQMARFQSAFPEDEMVWTHDESAFFKALQDAEIALCWRFDPAWFAKAPKLRKLGTPAAGRDFFPKSAPPEVEIRHGTFHGPLMAETLLGMMLAVNRGILDAVREQREGNLWPRDRMFGMRLLAGTHAVIIGFGRIGMAFGRLLKAFGVRVTGMRRTVGATLPAGFGPEDRVVSMDRVEEILPTADHLILILPNDTDTDRMFGARWISLLPSHAVVYNLGRGNCVDEEALADALLHRRIRGACLDVFAQEPLTTRSPLAAELPGLLRMPHSSAFADQYMDAFAEEVVKWLNV